MPGERVYYVYIMSSHHRTIYIGMTGDIFTRVQDHKSGRNKGFTKKYKCHFLVYYEEYGYPDDAISREKQLKKWRREKKIKLIEILNPGWRDLSNDFYPEE